MTLSERFDEVDKKIITLLQEDPNLTHEEIARRINRSQPTIGIRLRKLLESKIFQIQPGVNFKSVNVYIGKVNIQTKNPERFSEVAGCCPFVLNCFSVSGDYNIILFIVSTRLDYIDAIVNTHFRKHEDSQRVNVEIITDFAKDFIIPINFEEQELHDPTGEKECVAECRFCHQYLLDKN